MSSWRSLLLLLLLVALVSTQSTDSDPTPTYDTGTEKNFGDQCDPALNGYNQLLKYFDDCYSPMLACNSLTRTCAWKTCANVDYLKHWDVRKNPKVPQRCSQNQFCPDDGSACQDLLSPGAKCQLQRDDECSPNLPVNGGICMNTTCYVKAVQIGGACGVDFQQYNYAYENLVIIQQNIYRDNCSVGLTCDLNTNTCKLGDVLGSVCTQDRDCASESCSSGPGNPTGVCIQPPDTYNKLKLWQWIAIGFGVFGFVLLTLLVLFYLHRLQRRWEQARIAAFFGAQDDFKREIGYRDSDAKSTIVLATPQPDFKRRSATSSSQFGSNDLHFLKSGSANVSMISFQSEGAAGRVGASTIDPVTGLTHAENIKLQYQQDLLGGNGEGSALVPVLPVPPNSSSRRSHPLMHATSAQGINDE